MRLRTLAAAAALAVLLPALTTPTAHAHVPAPPAERAAAVTMRNLPSASEVGRKVRIAGAVKSGRRGTRVSVAVQRRYAGGRWRTVARGLANRKGRYALRVELTQGGPTSFRVRRAGGGRTAADSLAVYEWLDLVGQPGVALLTLGNVGVTTVIGGRSFPHSIEAASFPQLVYAVGACTAVQVTTGFRDAERAGLGPEARQETSFRFRTRTTETPAVTYSTPVGPAAVRTVRVPAGFPYLRLTTQVRNTAAGVSAVIGSPRARCNATRLPAIRYFDVFTD